MSLYDPVNSLRREDVLDAFSIGNAVFVYRIADLPEKEKAVKDLSKMLPLDRAPDHGAPSSEEEALIELVLGVPPKPDLLELSAINRGSSGYVWKVTFDLFPRIGGFPSSPYQYRGWVLADGTPIAPEIYLCDRINRSGTKSSFDFDDREDIDDREDVVFSVLAFADFNAKNEPANKIHGDEVLSIAAKSLYKALGEAELDEKKRTFRFHHQVQIKVPVAFRNDGHVVKKTIWEVYFIRSSATGDEIENASRLKIWVTSDGIPSTLSLNRWEAKQRREKPPKVE